MAEALRDLQDKAMRLDSTHYGDLPYLLGYAAAGDEISIVATDRNGRVRPARMPSAS